MRHGNKSRLLFSSAEMFKKPLWQTVWTIGAVCSGSTLFASILNSSMLGNYLQQTTSADDIFRCFFSWRLKGQTYMHPAVGQLSNLVYVHSEDRCNTDQMLLKEPLLIAMKWLNIKKILP